MRFEDQKAKLISELKSQQITDPKVLNAFEVINREDFVLPHLKAFAYKNQALPIKSEQTISQPFIVALMLQILQLQPEDVVLEIGTGSGYQTALLANIVDTVCSVERHNELTITARKNLEKYDFKNIFLRTGDGTKGWERAYPSIKSFDKIIVCAGAPDVSEYLKEQLKVNGIMVIPVGDIQKQDLKIIVRRENDYEEYDGIPCSFVPLIGEAGWEKS